MTMTTYDSFRDSVHALEITSVNRKYNHPPASINDADLPVQFVQFPAMDSLSISFDAAGGWPELRLQLVVILQPVVQDRQTVNFQATIDMMDNIAEQLRDDETYTISRSKVSWTMRGDIVTIAGHDYWAVICDITGRG